MLYCRQMHQTVDYYPQDESKLPLWHLEFARLFAENAEVLGFGDDEVAAARARAEMVVYVVQNYKPDIEIARLIAFEVAAKVLGDGGDLTPERALHPYPLQSDEPPVWVFGIAKKTRQLVAQIKLREGYSEALGHQMRIIGPRREHILSEPVLQLRALEGRRLDVRWFKHGASALELLVDGGAGFPVEGRLFIPAKFETHIPGEGAQTVQVRGVYWVKNERVGVPGPSFEVTLRA